MKIKVNETIHDIPVTWTLEDVRKKYKKDADILILNGFPIQEDCILNPDDHVVLIRRGEVPSPEEFETLITARHTPGVHEKIKNAVVGIAGLGGLGSAAALALARLGIGTMILADFDIVEPSNLNRQQYYTDQIGMTKVEALTQNLLRVNPYIRLEGHEVRVTSGNLPKLFASASVLVEAFDSAEAKSMIFNTALQKLPHLCVIGVSGLAGYGPSQDIRISRFSKRGYLVGDGITAAQPGTGLMSPRVGVAAHHQANLVLRILLGEEGNHRK